jgi:hypothetical protein
MRGALARSLIAAASLIAAGPATGRAQRTVERQALGWYAYFGSISLNSRWYVAGEFHERRFFDPNRVHQRLWRGHLHRRLSPALAVGAGYTHFMQGVQDPERPALPLVTELRPHLQLDHKRSLSPRFGLNQRARLEYRATPRTVDGRATEGYLSAGRLRYRAGLDLRLPPVGGVAPIARLSDEYHVMFGNRPLSFDQNRVQAGIDLPVTGRLSVETAWLWWYQRRPNGAVVDRDYLRVSIIHRLR